MVENERMYYECFYCTAIFQSESERETHIFENHQSEVQEKLGEIRSIAEKPENAQTIQEWKDSKKKSILLNLSQENPQALRTIMTSPESDEMIDKLIEMDLLKLALRTQTLSSDIIWMKSPRFEEARKKTEEEKTYEHKDESTGQSEQTFEIPESPEAKKVLEKATPINRVSFKSGKLILQPLSKDSLEQLSDKDKSLLILYSLMRHQKKKD
jgi:hypothetical protein